MSHVLHANERKERANKLGAAGVRRLPGVARHGRGRQRWLKVAVSAAAIFFPSLLSPLFLSLTPSLFFFSVIFSFSPLSLLFFLLSSLSLSLFFSFLSLLCFPLFFFLPLRFYYFGPCLFTPFLSQTNPLLSLSFDFFFSSTNPPPLFADLWVVFIGA